MFYINIIIILFDYSEIIINNIYNVVICLYVIIICLYIILVNIYIYIYK